MEGIDGKNENGGETVSRQRECGDHATWTDSGGPDHGKGPDTNTVCVRGNWF